MKRGRGKCNRKEGRKGKGREEEVERKDSEKGEKARGSVLVGRVSVMNI